MAEKLLMLALSPTMSTGLIARWIKKEGDQVSEGDVLCEVETDKASMEYESPASGVLLKIVLEEGSSASIGDLIGVIGQTGEDISALLTTDAPKAAPLPEAEAEVEQAAAAPLSGSAEPGQTPDNIRASPLARKLAEQQGLNLENIKGSGPAGRIVKVDIEKASASPAQAPLQARDGAQAPQAATKAGTQIASQVSAPQDTVVPVSVMRRVIARRLSESKFTAPHYYLKVQVEMDDLLEARRRLNLERDSKVSINAYLIKFVAEALIRHAAVNASWAGDTIIRYGRIDIGIAVALPDGLITPVIRDCAAKGVIQIDDELKVLVQKARDQSLVPEDYNGATFTISNLGSYGIEEFTAIINPPGSAILAVGEIRKTPVVALDDSVQVRSAMSMTLSCDHRVIDGAVGAMFLSDLKNMIQEPVRVLY